MLTYQETIWRKEDGFKIKKIQLDIKSISASKTIKEQKTEMEKISLVAFLNEQQNRNLVSVSRRLKRNDSDFYLNRKLHVTVLGFGPLPKMCSDLILTKIQQFSKKNRETKLNVIFNAIRPGAMYPNDPKTNPLSGLSNGTVIALGDVNSNKEFCKYSNELAIFLLRDERIKSVLGANFRKKLPSVWCSMGHYVKHRKFRISKDLETLFKQYRELNDDVFRFSISEISLVRSRYKNLRYPTILHNFKL